MFITFTSIGDAVLSTALLGRVLETYPQAEIDIVTGGAAVSFFAQCPFARRVVPVVKRKHHLHYVDLWRQLRHERYDIIIDLRRSVLPWFLKSKKTLRYRPAAAVAHTTPKAELLAAVWPHPTQKPLQLMAWVPDEVNTKVLECLHKHKQPAQKVVALAPTANWVAKRWPQKNFARFVHLVEQGGDAPVYVVLGAEKERVGIQDFLATLPPERTFDMVGKTTLPEAAAWLKNSDVFVGNDSGVAHIAGAFHVPSVVIFGPTNHLVYAPYSAACRVVLAPERPVKEVNLMPVAPKRLITDITPEMVYRQFVERLTTNRATTQLAGFSNKGDMQHA